MGNFITEYESFIASNIAYVMCGGDVPGGTIISEKYLLDLEREAFLKLCKQNKTVERIKHMLQRGKPLRNWFENILSLKRQEQFKIQNNMYSKYISKYLGGKYAGSIHYRLC